MNTSFFTPGAVWVDSKSYNESVSDTCVFTIATGRAKGNYRAIGTISEQYNVWIRSNDWRCQWRGVTKEQYEALPDWGFAIWRNPE